MICPDIIQTKYAHTCKIKISTTQHTIRYTHNHVAYNRCKWQRLTTTTQLLLYHSISELKLSPCSHLVDSGFGEYHDIRNVPFSIIVHRIYKIQLSQYHKTIELYLYWCSHKPPTVSNAHLLAKMQIWNNLQVLGSLKTDSQT